MRNILDLLRRLANPGDPQPSASPPLNELAGLPLRYLIGTDRPGEGKDGEIIEVGYDVERPPRRGTAIAYCNLWDEKRTGQLGPYLKPTGTARKYREQIIDPNGPGWEKNLRAQFTRRFAQGFRFVELDNADAYAVADVLGAVRLAADHRLAVVAKNPLLMEGDPAPYLAACCGAIVERGAGSVADMDRLRRRIGRPDLPVWFVAFGGAAERAAAERVAAEAAAFTGVGVTFSQGSGAHEYANSTDLLIPRV